MLGRSVHVMRKGDEDCRRRRCGFPGDLACFLHARQRVPLTAWCLAALLAVAALGATACTPVAPVSSASSGTSPSQSTASAETKEREVDLEELAQSLPKEGLPEKYMVTRKTKRNAAKVNATLRFILQILFKTVAVTFARRRF